MNGNLQEANTNRGAELGELIRKDRVAAGLSQSELARRSGIDKSTIYRLEQGEFTHLDPQRLQRIASALGTEVEDYFALSGYYTTHGLPNLGTYLRSKYDASPDVADDVEKYFRFPTTTNRYRNTTRKQARTITIGSYPLPLPERGTL